MAITASNGKLRIEVLKFRAKFSPSWRRRRQAGGKEKKNRTSFPTATLQVYLVLWGFPGGASGQESACQCQ